MLNIKLLENSGFFKKATYNIGDVIFDEGDIDNNIYIILIGELKVEQYTNENEIKVLTYLKRLDIFGEASLNSQKEKEVKISANKKTLLLSINAKEGINSFIKEYHDEGINFLKYIIFLSNKRLMEANKLILTTYEISKEIIEINEISYKAIFELIEKLKNITLVDQIIYYEKSPVLDEYHILKYDTQYKGKMLDKVIEITDSQLDLLSFKIGDIFSFIQKLVIGHNNLGYMIFFKKDHKFTRNEIRILSTASTSIAGLIKQKQVLKSEKDIGL